jgi:signal transduction histidine kinase
MPMEHVSLNVAGSEERVPKVVYGGVPYLLLAVSTALATLIPTTEPRPPLAGTLALVALAAVWLLWPIVVWPSWPERRVEILIFYVGLLLIILTLIAHSPGFTLFGALGYAYALSLLPPRLIIWGVAATGLVSAVAQHAWSQSAQFSPWTLTVNIAVPLLFVGWYVGRQSERRNEMIADLASANARLEAALEENAGLHVQLVAQAREAGVVDERQRIAREIHDTIAQGLVSIVAQLQAAESAQDRPEEWRRHVRSAMALAREGLTDARRAVRAIRPEELDGDALPQALAQVTERWSERTGVRAEHVVVGDPVPLGAAVEVALLRTAQEALSNVAKHAEAGRVKVTLSYIGDTVTLDVRDDGRGFDPSAPRPSGADGGYGLLGIRQRLAAVRGTLEVDATPGGGTSVSAIVPAAVPDAEEAHA